MFTKNYLTRNLKSLLLLLDVKCSKRRDLTRLNVSGVFRQQLPFVVSHKGAFVVPKSNQKYVSTLTTRKKTSSEKLAKSKLKKYINYILSQLTRFVKGKIADMYFKPKTREFTERDFKLIQNLVEKNQGNFPKSWQEFYQITGTNFNTFNS